MRILNASVIGVVHLLNLNENNVSVMFFEVVSFVFSYVMQSLRMVVKDHRYTAVCLGKSSVIEIILLHLKS